MADEIAKQLKLSKQLVMTPQLQMAIRLLGTPTAQLGALLDEFHARCPGVLVQALPGDPDLLDEPSAEDREASEESGVPWWTFAPPVVEYAEGDVLVFGNPPAAYANRRVLPYLALAPDARTLPADHLREAQWLLRSLRQRARTYEKVVAAIAALQPAIGIATSAKEMKPVPLRSIAEAVGMHESTISRVAAGCRIQNLHGVFALAAGKRGIGLA